MFLEGKKKERGGGGKGTRQAPRGGLAGRPRRGPGVGLPCPVLFNVLISWVRRWAERDSWGTGRVLGLPGGSFLPTCLKAIRGQGCDWSAQLKGPSMWDKAWSRADIWSVKGPSGQGYGFSSSHVWM